MTLRLSFRKKYTLYNEERSRAGSLIATNGTIGLYDAEEGNDVSPSLSLSFSQKLHTI